MKTFVQPTTKDIAKRSSWLPRPVSTPQCCGSKPDQEAHGGVPRVGTIPQFDFGRISIHRPAPVEQTRTAATESAESRAVFGKMIGTENGQVSEAIAAKAEAPEPASPPPRLVPLVSVRRRPGGVVAGAPQAGLTKKNDGGGPKTYDGGSFSWTIQWKLDKPSPKGGWIVQGVKGSAAVTDDKGKVVDTKAKGFDPALFGYWEAWQVNAGKDVTTYAEGGDTADDTFAAPSMGDKTKGTLTIDGTPEFYEGLTLPKSFVATNKPPSGILPVTRTAPTLTGGTGAIAHKAVATWDAVTGDKKTKLTTT